MFMRHFVVHLSQVLFTASKPIVEVCITMYTCY